jgi:class 3 adenylate cyclase/tetratricopeptide (TPR) repeat protein
VRLAPNGSDIVTSAQTQLSRLFERLLTAAEASLAAGDMEQARATAEEVRAVDPDNQRAAQILQQVATRQLGPSGERALMTLLFSDLVGSTMLSERVEPEQLRDLYSFYRAAAKEAVERYSGTVMQYTGDGILAGFGYPDPHEDDARRAVLAGLDLVTAMREGRADLDRRFGAAPEIRIGIHTGRVVVTDLRADPGVRERDSIVGAAPNLAARIQQAAEPGTVVISDVTQQLVDTDFYVHSLGVQELKGISRPVEVFAVERPRFAGARFEAERYRKADLVGRDQPRDRLFAAWEEMREGGEGDRPGATFLVTGEAGIGKTRLVADLLDRVESTGGEVLSAGCLPYYANLSLWPIGRMLERVIGVAGDDDNRHSRLVAHLDSLQLDLSRSVPFLAPLIGATEVSPYPVPELDPSAFLDETLNRLVDWLTALAAKTPHLFLVEDLHWADPSTLALLGRLVERGPGAILTVATTRDDSAITWREAVEMLPLSRLDAAASSTLVDNLAAGADLPGDMRASIIERAEGNPLFIEELTQSCLDSDRIEPIPLRLQELFTWRLKAPGLDLRVAQVAATVGPTFDAGTISAVLGDEALVTGQLVAMTDEGIIEPSDLAANTYRFRHALLRDAAYETQVLDVRSRNHAEVAEAIADRGAEPALVAEHLDRAGQADRAVGLYLMAAQAEQAHGAHPEATRLLSRALALLETFPESEDRDLSELTARMLRGLSVSSMQGYAAPDVQSDHRRAEALATRLGTRPEVLPSLIAIWAYWLTSGDLSTARGLIDRLSDMVRQPAFSWFEPEVESCAGWLDFYQGNLDSARVHLERGTAGFLARPAEQMVSPFWPLPNDPIAVSEIALACVSTLQGEPDEAQRWEREAVARAEEIGFPHGPFSLAFVKTYAAWIRRFLGQHDASRLLGSEVVGIGQAYGYAYWMMLGSLYVTTADPGGEPDGEFLEQTIATLRLMGQEAFAASSLAHLAHLNAEDDEFGRAHELIEEALEVVYKAGENVHLPELLRLRAVYSLARGGDDEEAVADLTEAMRVASEQGARVARLRAGIELARLPEAVRPNDWRILLIQARGDIASSLPTGETADADDLLAV